MSSVTIKMEGPSASTSSLMLGLESSDLPLTSDIKEEILDHDILPDVPISDDLGNTNPEINAPTSESVVESPTTGDSSSNVNVWNSKCVFCDRLPTAADEPKLLECLHSACSSCINNQGEQNQANVENPPPESQILVCKICDMRSTTNQIIENQFLIELSNATEEGAEASEKVTEIKCSSCSDEASATSWCVDCQEFICDNCVQAHQRLKITKDHTIKAKDDILDGSTSSASSSVPKSLFCSVHSHERLTLFCVSCDKLTCRDCQLTEHRDHKYKFIQEIAEETRNSMALLLKDVSYKRVLLSSAMTVIDDRQKLIHDKKNSLVKEITQMVVRLTNAINVRGKQLVMRLNEVCDAKQKTLNEKREALDQLSMLTDHCVGFTQHALDRGSDMALLHSKRHVLAHLNRIKSRRADIPNPEIPVRIHLALDKVPDLIKVVSSIGAIVVDGKIYPSNNNINNNGVPHQSPSPQALPPMSPQSQLQQLNGPPQSGIPQNISGNIPLHSLPQVFGRQLMARPPHSMQNPQQPQQRTPPTILPRPPPYHQGQSPVQQAQVAIIRLPGSNNQQVTSSTHPQNMAPGDFNHNLRGLLQTAPAGYVNNQVYGQQNAIYRMNNQQSIQQQQQAYRAPPPNYGNFSQPQQMTPLQRAQIRFAPTNQQQHQMQNFYQQQNQQKIMLANQNHQMMAGVRIQRPSGATQPANQMYPMQQFVQRPQHSQGMQQQQSAGAQWHIPQHQTVNGSSNQFHDQRFSQSHSSMKPDDSFKITLKNIAPRPSPDPAKTPTGANTGVSSTIPKTPSPNTLAHVKQDDAERKLDKFCQDSVNDLMATIAKLDSNGVQVLAERKGGGGGCSPHVDSSTDNRNGSTGSATSERRSSVPSSLIKNPMSATVTEAEKDDPNEDWCAVCMDGGELVCCDKCPKVFHQYCHIPNLSVEESDTWQCLLCMNFADIPNNSLGDKREQGLTPKERKIAERIVLELYCQYEPSLPFRELVSPDNVDYYTKITKPIALDVIRRKVDWSMPGHYSEIIQLISDVRLMFRNAYNFNERGTQVYNDAQRLEEFFDQQLEKWLPAYAYEDPLRDEEDKLYPPLKRYRRIMSE